MSVTKTFKLVLAFDGTDFCGWQLQLHNVTIHSVMVDAFTRAFATDVVILGPSRTDAGVHALGYVASAKINLQLPAEKIREVWNAHLPESVSIRSLEQVADDFNPRKGICWKEYHYHFFLERPLPFAARFGWHSGRMRNFDLERFNTALRLFEGKHNFRAFCRIDPGEVVNVVRQVDFLRATRLKRWGVISVVAKAPGFLRYQIRRMVGAAFALTQHHDMSVDLVKRALATGEITAPKLTLCLPAKGLCLRRVVYGLKNSGGIDGNEAGDES